MSWPVWPVLHLEPLLQQCWTLIGLAQCQEEIQYIRSVVNFFICHYMEAACESSMHRPGDKMGRRSEASLPSLVYIYIYICTYIYIYICLRTHLLMLDINTLTYVVGVGSCQCKHNKAGHSRERERDSWRSILCTQIYMRCGGWEKCSYLCVYVSIYVYTYVYTALLPEMTVQVSKASPCFGASQKIHEGVRWVLCFTRMVFTMCPGYCPRIIRYREHDQTHKRTSMRCT